MRLSSLLLTAALLPALARGQELRGLVPIQQPSRATLGLTAMVSDPQGEFGTYVGAGYGLMVDLVPKLGHAGVFGLRLELGFLQYGSETKRACLSYTVGCRITVDVTTSNDILVAGIGPQIMAPSGAVRPYATGTVGLAYFFTHSSVSGTSDTNPFADSENFHDAVLAWTGGGGMLITVRRGARPIFIDVGVRYHHNGRASYLREGSIVDNPDGSITITPITSQTNFVAYRIGVSIGI
jgi:hypothetical protein